MLAGDGDEPYCRLARQAHCWRRQGRPAAIFADICHAHRVLHRTLARAAAIESVSRNVASFVKPPKADETEIESLKADEMDAVLTALKDHWLEPIAVLALSSGARRGELLALNWANVDLDAGTIKIERSLEQTKAGLRYKAPKTKNGRRVVSLPPIAVDALRAHRRRQLEFEWFWAGQARAGHANLLHPNEGDPIPPNKLVPRLGPVR
jgi:integrase